MGLAEAIRNAQILATEKFQPHHVVRRDEHTYAIGKGYKPDAVENLFPAENAYGAGMTCRNGSCG